MTQNSRLMGIERAVAGVDPFYRGLTVCTPADYALGQGRLYQAEHSDPDLRRNRSFSVRMRFPEPIFAIAIAPRFYCDEHALAVATVDPVITTPGTPIEIRQRNELKPNESYAEGWADDVISDPGQFPTSQMIGAGLTTIEPRYILRGDDDREILLTLTNEGRRRGRAQIIVEWLEFREEFFDPGGGVP